MSALELVGLLALGIAALRFASWLFRSKPDAEPMIPMKIAEEQITHCAREAFESGMLCAADIVTYSGNEELAGDIRRTAKHVRANE